jgi:hypothetical protein
MMKETTTQPMKRLYCERERNKPRRIRIARSAANQAGACNFCQQSDFSGDCVIVIDGNGIQARLCLQCLSDLKEATKRILP